jgi:non-ribosomal peptide synthetase component F
LTATLNTLSQQENVTLFMTLEAAFSTVLARYSGQDDIVVGTVIAGRDRPEFEGLIGCFLNTLVLRTDLSGDPTFRTLLRRVQMVCANAYAHQDVPFEVLIARLQTQRDPSRTSLYQVMFMLQNFPSSPATFADLAVAPLKDDQWVADAGPQCDLTLIIKESPHGLVGTVMYDSTLFDASTILRMLWHLQTLLEGIAADPDQRLSVLPLLTIAERQQTLVEWNTTQADYPAAQTFPQLFEAQVARTPDAVAVALDRPTTDHRPTTNDDTETRRQGDDTAETQNSKLKTQNFSSILSA